MKQKLLIYILAVFVTNYTAGQVTTIEFDFSNKTIDSNSGFNKLRQGDFYKLKINCINLNVYRVEIDTKDSMVYKPLDFAPMISGVSGLGALFESASRTLTSIKLDTIPRQEKIKTNGDSDNKNRDLDLQKLKGYATKFDSLSTEGKELGKGIEELESRVNLRLAESRLISISALKPVDLDFISTIDKEYLIISQSVVALSKKFKEDAKAFNTFIENIKDTTGLLNNINELKSAVKELGAAISKLDSSSNLTYRNKLKAKLFEYVNNSSVTYESLPIQLTKDVSHIDIKVIPIDSGSRLPSYHSRLAIPSKQNWFWAVGTGGYISGLYDETYSLRGTKVNDSTSYYSIVREDVDTVDATKTKPTKEFGASINLKVGYRLPCAPDVGFHVSLGSGFSFTKDIRPRLMLGVGTSFGYKHRLTIDYGWIAGYTERLSRAYQLSDNLPEAVERVTVSKVQHSWFLSLGYVFTL